VVIYCLKGKSAVHDSCASFNTNDFQTSRGRYQENLREIMRKYCESLYCELYELQVNNVQRPQQFETAVKEKEAAKENIRVAETERPRLILQAETELEQAKKQAEIILNNAKTEAAIITNKAETESKAILLQYKKDLEVYKKLKDTQGLDNEALLSYLAVKAIGSSKEEVNIAMKSPARTSYKNITD
jgi:regulator of protease activity HflC (stomatin/prohibitin superfamily)